MSKTLIYGATGYTGRLACDHAKSTGLDFMIGGRDERKLKALSALLDIRYRVFDASDETALLNSLQGVQVLLNCAGPFSMTAKPLMQACIHNGTHYLDTSAELISYQLAEELDQKAQEANVMLLPGCGGSVSMFSCLSAYAMKNIPSDKIASIDVALGISGAMSLGSANSAAQSVTNAVLERRDGQLVESKTGSGTKFQFGRGAGELECIQVTLPDLITLAEGTSVANIRSFLHISGSAVPSVADPGPTQQEREDNPYRAAVFLTMKDGSTVHAVLETVNGYTFTAMASIEAARRVLEGDVEAGFQTPAQVFGPDFVTHVAGSSMYVVQ